VRTSAHGASPIKTRRTQAEMAALRQGLYDIVAAQRPMTVRQVFYRAVSAGLIPKTEAAYKTTVGRLLTLMRRDGELPYGWIADNTRWMRKTASWHNLSDMLEQSTQFYRRALWDDQWYRCEVWLEKDALAGVVADVTGPWDVPLMVTRGYPSLSFLHEAAEAVNANGKDTVIFYLGDHDPSGEDIPRFVERELADRLDVELEFVKVAVTAEQIEDYDLATRPTKQSDSRARNFEGESVEVDAIEPDDLRLLVEDAITSVIDSAALARHRTSEAAERESLDRFVEAWSGERP
jgi:hypothetical protein